MVTNFAEPSLPTASVFGVKVHLSDNYGHWLENCLQRGQGVHVVTLNSEMVMLAEKEPAVQEVIQGAELVIPDGAGVTIYLKLEGIEQSRCPGIELAEAMVRHIGEGKDNQPIAFYGGAPGITELAAQRWQREYPGLKILANHGFLTESEQDAWQQTLARERPCLILVGLGVPRQEYWIRDHRHLCPQGIWIGVGGSFDVWSGTKQRAPEFFCRYNLEWFYRLYQEPWRWRRMLALPKFFFRTLVSR
ncbi:UDP-N-acetyl-D-mannosaminuronic acid transferase [Synechocystis sp. PCC 6803]|uniref:UDP-N-acetyl-D-mannosaminuronic acid transferase n=1 Tax=Synechocystis sp. (strain ATCC 27184 / PCC 6803 / Kazusa) TaxID=1111708 RepID=P74183_SYNY3|nr:MULTISPECIES: WecB/TagA/CpsF family glycosyltransferase [unclassified Synechocystis]AGF51960.1 UDP-N-acetyl-D-mannosaminuronic acid transferase [Synechocystis sp. PCC 6803]ALJ67928.1 UDP-N-acetyl-D-mannosaminuronic acid transferase [Synechocystis sp. PCC 6803]AVP89762.1 glycosyltransferase [Synechocystis sp. IPPAS B-1465]MBD2619217.1 WecB/TagA/CpsF family glycosyltransferase [Synechocystis sp. FACHB-898]MBD2639603.1 WecB/TagA/CpsF family glycosyltransferase [Synechocystis sp. FACHB-908]